MLKKIVNGEEVVMSAEEESSILEEWAASDTEALKPKTKTLEERIAALEALVGQ